MTPKQQRFCEEYLVDLCATQAAIRAGYSPRSARQIGDENMSKPDIVAEIERLKEARKRRNHVTADMVIEELRRLAFSDERKLYRDDGTLKPPAEWDDETAAAVSGIETRENRKGVTTKKVRLWDKKGALELLGKHLGIFKDRLEVTGAGGGPVTVEVYIPANGRDNRDG